MKRSTKRILTTHVGSLVRPPEIQEIQRRKEDGEPFTEEDLGLIKREVAKAVRTESDVGIDIPSDGEYSKAGWFGYVTDRLAGHEYRRDLPGRGDGTTRSRDRDRFPEAYMNLDLGGVGGGGGGGGGTGRGNLVWTGPVTYRGQKAVENDIASFRAAMQGLNFEEAFIPACGPGTIELRGTNHYYKTEEEYLFAIAEAMAVEYKMIVDAGFILQIDDPRIVTEWNSMDPEPTAEEYRKFAAVRIEALNHALKGLPEDRVRYHLCWGSWHGPHTTDAPLKEIADVILGVNAGAYVIEAANPRHEHEYHVWEGGVTFPEGKIIIPGVIAHTTNCVEHPELIAERIMRYARIVGRENVIAGADCGFAQSAGVARVHSSIMWEKFRMLAEGARLATQRLWA